MKTKKIILLSVVVIMMFLMAVCSNLIITANAMTLNLFDSKGMKIIAAEMAPQDKFTDLRKGLILQGKEGSYAQFKKVFVGEFDLELLVYSKDAKSASTKIQFKDEQSNQSFFVDVFANGYDYNVSVNFNGEPVGLAYQNGGLLLGVTAGCNKDGRYTEVSDGGALTLSFNPSNMCLYVSNETVKDRLVWDFTQQSIDGKNIGETLQNFNSYSVKFLPSGDEEVNTFIYSVNDQKLNDSMFIKNAPARVWADIVNYGVKNQPYKIPQPVAFDLLKGAIDNAEVIVSVANQSHVVVKQGVWTKDFSFTPETSGEYTITYTLEDQIRNSVVSSVYTASVVVLDEQPAIEFSLSNDIPECVPTGSIVEMPSAYFTACSYIRNVISNAKISVYFGEELISEDLTSKNFKFENAGVYTIKYTPENSNINCEQTFTVRSENNGYFFNILDNKDTCLVGDEFIVSEAYLVLNGEEVKANHIVVFPDGASYSNSKFKVTQAGTHKIIYTATVNGTKYSQTKLVNAYVKGSEMFINNSPDGLPLTITEGKHNMTDNLNGVIVTSEERGSVRYKNVINLSKKSKDDMLVDLIVMPTVQGQEDFKRIVITLTDIYDCNNFIRIELNDPAGRDECGGTSTYVTAGANGQTQIGINGKDVWEHVYEDLYYTPYYPVSYGYSALHSFSSRVYHVPLEMQTFKLYFDMEEKAVYGSESWYNTWNNPATKSYLITDLDDPKLYTKLWDGFTTGEVYMDITTSGLESVRNTGATEKATYMILGVDGVYFSDYTFKDTKAPELKVNVPNKIPLGEYKKPYKVFDAVAYDISNGVIKPKVNVYYDYGKDTCVQVDVKDGNFLPIYSGIYSIVYTASDIYGNATIKVVDVNVKRSLSPLNIQTLSYDTTTFVGVPVSLPDVKVSGGTQSNYTITKSVFFDGEKIGLDGDTFLPLRSGKYDIIIKVEDYIGNTSTISYQITANISDLPILNEEIVLSNYYINELTYYLPVYEAIDYSNPSNPVSIKPVITTIDANGENVLTSDLEYIPKVTNRNDTVQVIYSYTSSQGKKLQIIKEIPAINPLTQDGDIDKTAYFVIEGETEVTAHSDKIEYELSSNVSLEFTKALLANKFSVVFNVDKSNANMEAIVLTLTDALDSSKSVKIDVIREPGKTTSQVRINNGAKQTTDWSFDVGNTNCELYYDNQTFMIYGVGKSIIGRIDTYTDGSKFNGFESGSIYLKVDVIGVTTKTSFYMVSINNQTLNNVMFDTVAPSIVFEKEIILRSKVGEVVYLPSAYAGDVLGDASVVKVSVRDLQTNKYVTDVNGRVLYELSAKEATSFIPTNSGKYFVQYYSLDNSGNETYEDRYIFVSAIEIKPLEIKRIPSSASVGRKIKLPRPEAEDGVNYYIILVNPSGYEEIIKEDSFKVTMKGTYIVKYVSFDKDYTNSITQEFTINVK